MRTYKQSYDLLTEAYISGKVDPWDCKACFCGNLLRGTSDWEEIRNPVMSHVIFTGKGRILNMINPKTLRL
jgi:hypothetical protein